MARIYPFRALRYDTNRVKMEDVVTQPYDKITPRCSSATYDASPYNLIRVILGKRLPGDTEPQEFLPPRRTGPQLLHPRRRVPESWRKENILKEEPQLALYGYSQTYTVPHTNEIRERRGFIALGHLYDYAEQVVYRTNRPFPSTNPTASPSSRPPAAYCEQIYMLYSDPAFTAEKLIFGDSPADINFLRG